MLSSFIITKWNILYQFGSCVLIIEIITTAYTLRIRLGFTLLCLLTLWSWKRYSQGTLNRKACLSRHGVACQTFQSENIAFANKSDLSLLYRFSEAYRNYWTKPSDVITVISFWTLLEFSILLYTHDLKHHQVFQGTK